MNTTPGPWTVRWGHDVSGYPCFFIAGMSGDKKRDKALLDANAHLIAAAPEMLRLLQDVQSWLETNLKQGNINAGTANRDGDLVSQLRHTITRATGRERGE